MRQNLTKPIRCLLWGSGSAFRDNYQTIKYFESSDIIQVYGVTSNAPIYSEIGGYKFVSKDMLDASSFDVVIVMSYSKGVIDEICNEATVLGVNPWNIIPCSVIRQIGFDFDKYREIKKNPPTIFAPNCWGGITYHKLALRFDSPFINMYENHDDYLKFLLNPKHYLSCELQFKKMMFEENLKRDFPVAMCDDILLFFNHYTSFDEANDSWNKRKQRINWNNLFVMFYDEDLSRVERFCSLPYQKKICFVPFETKLKNVLSVKYRVNELMEKKPFWEIVNGMASGTWLYYDVFDLLLYGRITYAAKLLN